MAEAPSDMERYRSQWGKPRAPDHDDRLNPPSGGGISGGMSEESLKPRVDFLHTAFLWLAGAIITVALAVVTVNVTTSNTTNGRIDKLTEGVSVMNREAGEQSMKQDDTSRRLESMEGKLDKMDEKLDALLAK